MKNSKMEIAAFNSDQICAIIKACGQSGVREFVLDKLKISFGPIAPAPAIEPLFVLPEIQKQSDSQAREAIARKEFEIKDDLIQSLIVEDPEGYERLLKDEELFDEED